MSIVPGMAWFDTGHKDWLDYVVDDAVSAQNVGDSFAIVAAEHGLRCIEVATSELPPFYQGFGMQMGVLRVVLAAS